MFSNAMASIAQYLRDGGDADWIVLALTFVALGRAVRLVWRWRQGERVPVWAWILLPAIIASVGGIGGAFLMREFAAVFDLAAVDRPGALAARGISHAHHPVVLALGCAALTLMVSATFMLRSRRQSDDPERADLRRASTGLCAALAWIATSVGGWVQRDSWIWMSRLALESGRPPILEPTAHAGVLLAFALALALAPIGGALALAPYARRAAQGAVRRDLCACAALILLAASLIAYGKHPGAFLLGKANLLPALDSAATQGAALPKDVKPWL